MDKKKKEEQSKPGKESKMTPKPQSEPIDYANGKLSGKKILITGGDSGIGRAVALLFAKEGADVAIVYLNEDDDALETKKLAEKYGTECINLRADLSKENACKAVIQKVEKKWGYLDVLVNNAATQWARENLEDITTSQLQATFETNFFSCFWMSKYALPLLKKGSAIINTTSITAYHGNPKLMDYSATKGAILAFTRSLSINLSPKGIRVNAVAPGPVWTPLIVSSFKEEDIKSFGKDTPMQRPGQPNEIAPAYLFLASEDASYISGQVIHPNGGQVINT